MTSLTQKLQDDARTALKSKDVFSLGVLRMVIAALHNKSIEKRGRPRAENEVVAQGRGLDAELTDEETLVVLQQEAKRRVSAAALYEKGGRADLAEQERKEAAFIQKYLPAQFNREEIIQKINAIKARLGSADFSAIMKEAMKELKGRADGKLVGEVITEELQK